MDNKYTFFYGGVFSQWHTSKFKIFNIRFNNAEQWMMYSKAMLFKDLDAADKILKSSTPREQKFLGRKVRNFNQQKWENVARDIVYKGNMAKFKQNKHLTPILLNTYPTILVEASPYDNIWGIGISINDASNTDPLYWPGKNWLGLTLTKVRDDIIRENENRTK